MKNLELLENASSYGTAHQCMQWSEGAHERGAVRSQRRMQNEDLLYVGSNRTAVKSIFYFFREIFDFQTNNFMLQISLTGGPWFVT